MARLTDILGKVVYLDTNLFIYAVEGYEPEREFVYELFAALDRRGFVAVTSEFTIVIDPAQAIYPGAPVQRVRHSRSDE